jgi:flagellar basal-body rod protein FlgB
MIPGISDNTTSALQASIQGLDVRAAAIKNNIANVETPGYQSQVVSFEDSLRTALAGGDPEAATASMSYSTAPTRLNGNNVSIDNEMTDLTQTELRQQLAIAALNAKYKLLRTAITGG